MSDTPEAVEGYVCYEQSRNETELKSPAEAEILAMNLLSEAAKARAYRLAERGDVPQSIGGDPEDVDSPAD